MQFSDDYQHSDLKCLSNIKKKILNLRRESDDIKPINQAELHDAYIRDTNTARSTSASKSELSYSAAKSRNIYDTQRKESWRDLSKQRDLSEQTILRMKSQCQDKIKQMYLKKFNKSFKVLYIV